MLNSILMVAATASKTPTEQFMANIYTLALAVVVLWAAFGYLNLVVQHVTPKQGAILNVIVFAFVSALTVLYWVLCLFTEGFWNFIGMIFPFLFVFGITCRSVGGVYEASGDMWKANDWREKGTNMICIGILGMVIVLIIVAIKVCA